jgi:esterase FrsA
VSAQGGPVAFERHVIEAEHLGERVPVAVHQFSPPNTLTEEAPVLIASGGVDTWKEDLHPVWVAYATWTQMTVLAFDIAGTGESTVPMTPDGGADIVSSLVREARELGNGRVAHVGISMGGHFAARTGLIGEVDAAVVVGGPVKAAFAWRPQTNTNMTGVVGNAFGFQEQPTDEELAARWAAFSLADLLKGHESAPMFVVNGADDPLIPQEDTLLFQGRPGAEVHLIPDSGHCATNKIAEVMPQIFAWLGNVLAPQHTP